MAATMDASRGRRGGIVGINITPMVDVVLVLLIIMMVSATYIVSQSIKVELPRTATADDSVSSVAAVTITKDGQTYFNQKLVSDAELISRLREAHASSKDVNLVVTADQNVFHGRVMQVIDVAKLEGISKFAINVERSK